MPSTLYSTTCYIKNNSYRLRICVDDDDNNTPTDNDGVGWEPISLTTDQYPSTNSIPISPSYSHLIRLKFERIIDEKQKKSSSTTDNIIPEMIILKYLLNVKQTTFLPNGNRQINRSGTVTPIKNTNSSSLEDSQLTTRITLTPSNSEILMERLSSPFKPNNIRRFFSTQTNTNNEAILLYKTQINLSYIEIINHTQWVIKRGEIVLDDEVAANELYSILKLCLATLKQRPKHLLAFVNPLCGKGRARFVYEKKVLPIFEEANIVVDAIFTERANHGRDFVTSEVLHQYDGLISVGGDGMFAELCHGLLLRTAQEAQLNIDDPQVNLVKPALRIGLIPAGSTDAVVFGTTGLNDPVTSALQIVVGESLPIDITTVHSDLGFVRFMATMLAYGFFGDIIEQSDQWRCLGPLRYDLAGFCQFIRNTSYHSELTITLSPHDATQICHPNPQTPTISQNNGGSTSAVAPDHQQLLANYGSMPKSTKNTIPMATTSEIVTPRPIFCQKDCRQCSVEEIIDPGKVHQPLQIKLEGRYTTINCLNMPCRCAKSKYGMSPFVHLGDGTFDLILVKRSWRTGFLRFLWQVANDGRSIEDLPNVERYRVNEVLIRPVTTHPNQTGHWACDGELIHGKEIQIRAHRQVLNLFASGIQFENMQEVNNQISMKSRSCCSCFRVKKDNKN